MKNILRQPGIDRIDAQMALPAGERGKSYTWAARSGDLPSHITTGKAHHGND
jgi:hypothetical protein